MSLRALSDASVLAGFTRLVRQSQALTAALLAHILEIEQRQLYRDVGYESVRAFLILEHHFSEDSAAKRIQAAHAVRRWPQLLERIADGRLHLSAVCMLAPHLDESNAEELVEAATHRTRSQIDAMLRACKQKAAAPQPEIILSANDGHAPGHVDDPSAPAQVSDEPPAPGQVHTEPAPGQVPPDDSRLSKIAIRESTRQMLRRAHDLLAGAVRFGDHDQVIHRALGEFIARREKRKFAMTAKPRPNPRPTEDPRTIPAAIRRAVVARDGGRCTHVGPTGHRCESRAVEFDHIVPIAKGGASTLSNLRLLCRPHNQLEAERAFGRDFMDRKKSESDDPERRDLISGLRSLGYRAGEAREAAEFAMREGGLTLERRMRAALAFFRPRRTLALAGG